MPVISVGVYNSLMRRPPRLLGLAIGTRAGEYHIVFRREPAVESASLENAKAGPIRAKISFLVGLSVQHTNWLPIFERGQED